jgi:hypothetical protein
MRLHREKGALTVNVAWALLLCALSTIALIGAESAATQGQMPPISVTENSAAP